MVLLVMFNKVIYRHGKDIIEETEVKTSESQGSLDIVYKFKHIFTLIFIRNMFSVLDDIKHKHIEQT